MDVTFTNVLEGARQYFQGLPAATGSTASPSYTDQQQPQQQQQQQQHGRTNDQNVDRSAANVPYWPPQQEQQRAPTQERTSAEPPPTSHVQTASDQQQSSRAHSSSSYHAQVPYSEAQSSYAQQQFHFSRPQSREAPSNVLQQQQYQSHILPNPSYHQPASPQQQQQMRAPSRQPNVTPPSSQSYYQMQSSPAASSNQNQQQQQQSASNAAYQHNNNNYQQQSRSYYPAQTYMPPSGQQYNKTSSSQSNDAYYQKLYTTTSQQHASSVQDKNMYATSKSAASQERGYGNQDAVAQENSMQLQQGHRTTHNLPPIAALSSANYHSSRASIRTPVSKNKVPTASSLPTPVAASNATTTNNSYSVQYSNNTRVPSVQYGTEHKQHDYRNSIQYGTSNQQQGKQTNQHHIQRVPNASQTYEAAPASATSQTYSTQQHQSSNQQYYQFANKTDVHRVPQHGSYLPTQQHAQQPSALQSVPQQQQQVVDPNANRTASVVKQKRESPLDLSVKTVRTPADSTLDDMEVSEAQRAKYSRPPVSSNNQAAASHSYPTYDVYANAFQRNMGQRTTPAQTAGAPKVDFLPNFNVPSLNHSNNSRMDSSRRGVVQYAYDKHLTPRVQYDKTPTAHGVAKNNTAHRVPVSSTAQSTGYSSSYSSTSQASMKKSVDSLPRIDFPPTSHVHQSSVMYPVAPHGTQRKRPAETAPSFVSSKVSKVDAWRQTIDQQIEQRLSSYAKRFNPQQTPSQNASTKSLINGAYSTANQEKSKETYSYSRTPYNTLPSSQSYSNTSQYHQSHNQTYVPSVGAHQYPGYSNYGSHQNIYPQPTLHRTNSNSSLAVPNRNNAGGANKRVLSLLRNSLEIKGAKEAQKKFEQEKFKTFEATVQQQHPRPEVQQPSTDVTAPLQPKTGMMGRHNVSPFTASSLLERNSNTPPIYKFHIPKAIDSVRFDTETSKSNSITVEKQIINTQPVASQNNTELDGLAAFLAARIRTKAELKQVGPTQNSSSNNNSNSSVVIAEVDAKSPSRQGADSSAVLGANGLSSGGSPPKLIKEKQSHLPRRRLFSKNEEETGVITTAPPRDKSGMRSSSETSVFDFPDTDSEGEMPVLERQSLEDMRRDRKTFTKPPSNSAVSVNVKVESSRSPSPLDDVFDAACNNFMEQLKQGNGKKRGRRKKGVEPEVIAMLETVTKEKPLETDVKIKEEQEPDAEILANIKKEVPEELKEEAKVENESDSDVPLINCKNKNQFNDNDSELIKRSKAGVRRRIVSSSESSSDSETETVKQIYEKLKTVKENNVFKVNDESFVKTDLACNQVGKPVKKPMFGDGTAFHPGWEEEVYKYKRSLRMPQSLIQLTRPPNCQRLSTSLPDLDPCPNSPTPSSVADNMEYLSKPKVKVKSEVDSDLDSNSSFSFSFSNRNYDSEGSCSSVKSLNISSKDNNSILDKLLERYGKRKRKKYKKKDEPNGPKVIPKAENPIELLATPSLEVGKTKPAKKLQPVVKLDSVLLGFRKTTVNNFKDAFINNSNSLVGINEQFTTVVLKSRTRTETRVLKQRATIKEVFGEDRPASAPPITCIDNVKQEIEATEVKKEADDAQETKENNNTEMINTDVRRSPILRKTKQALKDKLLNKGRKRNSSLLKVLADKKIKTEYPDDEVEHIKQDPDAKSETPSLDGDDSNQQGGKKRLKLRNMRRKFSSGFDYIRKKKKQTKKDAVEENSEQKVKPIKRRGLFLKTSPESEQDIQKEIKMWVLNKGIGETHLHRAARLGYTDITAYCLEKMGCHPSPKDNAGYTPLHEACSRGHLNIAKLLLKYGANVSESAQGGIRPLHEAIENGYVEIVRLLLSYGADPMLATYSGLTPLSLAIDDATVNLIQHHLADVQGRSAAPWTFLGPASCFDPEESGYNPLEDVPEADPPSEEEDMEFEISDAPLPNLYTLRGDGQSDRWILLQDLSNMLKIKSKDALLRQISQPGSSGSTATYKNIFRELKMSEFLEQARCCQFLNGSEKVNTRASKIALVKYTDKVKQLLNVEDLLITAR